MSSLARLHKLLIALLQPSVNRVNEIAPMAKKRATTRPPAPVPARDPDDVIVLERLHTPGSLSDVVDRVRDAVIKAVASEEDFPDILDVEKKFVVYRIGGGLFRLKYSMGPDGNVILGTNPEAVVIQYVPASRQESATTPAPEANQIEIVEANLVMPVNASESPALPDGIILAKLIEPGEGSSGLYPVEVLQRDGPAVFHEGTHMYWNHPTQAEMSERPEGDMSKLAGVLDSDATYEADGPDGPGLYATISVVEEYTQAVRELAPFTGLSIRAQAMGEPREGETTPVLTKLLHAHSVDFVTRAGAGGRIVTAFESAGRGEYVPGAVLEISETATVKDPIKESDRMSEDKNDKQAKAPESSAESIALRESNDRLAQRLIRMEARDSVSAAITAAGINDPVIHAKVLEGVLTDIPLDAEREVDPTKLAERVKDVLETELTYLKRIQGVGAHVRDLGEASAPSSVKAPTEEDLAKIFARPAFGLTEAGAKVAARN